MGIEPQPPPFIPFDVTAPTRMYKGNLPHWRQEDVTYFVTYRIGDALPASVLANYRKLQSLWLARHGIEMDRHGMWRVLLQEISTSDRDEFWNLLSETMQDYLDRGYGSCLLRDGLMRRIVVASLEFFHTDRFWLGDYVIMPNHVHLLATPVRAERLEDILESIKRFSARKLNNALGRREVKFWQGENYDHIVRDLDELRHFRAYIVENPQKAELREPEYSYCRATWMDKWFVTD